MQTKPDILQEYMARDWQSEAYRTDGLTLNSLPWDHFIETCKHTCFSFRNVK